MRPRGKVTKGVAEKGTVTEGVSLRRGNSKRGWVLEKDDDNYGCCGDGFVGVQVHDTCAHVSVCASVCRHLVRGTSEKSLWSCLDPLWNLSVGTGRHSSPSPVAGVWACLGAGGTPRDPTSTQGRNGYTLSLSPLAFFFANFRGLPLTVTPHRRPLPSSSLRPSLTQVVRPVLLPPVRHLTRSQTYMSTESESGSDSSGHTTVDGRRRLQPRSSPVDPSGPLGLQCGPGQLSD